MVRPRPSALPSGETGPSALPAGHCGTLLRAAAFLCTAVRFGCCFVLGSTALGSPLAVVRLALALMVRQVRPPDEVRYFADGLVSLAVSRGTSWPLALRR